MNVQRGQSFPSLVPLSVLYEIFVTTTFCALTPAFCLSNPDCTDRRPSPTVKGSGAGTIVPDSSAFGRNSRQIYGPTLLLKISLEETITDATSQRQKPPRQNTTSKQEQDYPAIKEQEGRDRNSLIFPLTELGSPVSGTPCTVTTIAFPFVRSKILAQA